MSRVGSVKMGTLKIIYEGMKDYDEKKKRS